MKSLVRGIAVVELVSLLAVSGLSLHLVQKAVVRMVSDANERFNSYSAKNFATKAQAFHQNNNSFLGDNFQHKIGSSQYVYDCGYAVEQSDSVFSDREVAQMIRIIEDKNNLNRNIITDMVCYLDSAEPDKYVFAWRTSKPDTKMGTLNSDWSCVSTNMITVGYGNYKNFLTDKKLNHSECPTIYRSN